MTSHVDDIDALLQQYLGLLDEYTQLREELSSLLSAAYHQLARANFAAERGVRYGASFYDERMAATRVVDIAYETAASDADPEPDPHGEGNASSGPAAAVRPDDSMGREARGRRGVSATPTFSVATRGTGAGGAMPTLEDDLRALDLRERAEDEATDEKEHEATDEKEDEASDETAQKQESRDKAAPHSKDPLRWFGVLVPPPLRLTQQHAVTAVERVVPRLVQVDAAMKEVEIAVRQARKRAAKEKVKREPAISTSSDNAPVRRE